MAKAMEVAEVDIFLIGDSLGMTIQGNDSTLPVTVEDMAYHTAAVRRGNKHAFILTDLPFMTYATLNDALVEFKDRNASRRADGQIGGWCMVVRNS